MRTEDIGRSGGVPLPFLSKITQALMKHGIVQSMRGRGGGISLTRPPHQIGLEEIVSAASGVDLTGACVLGLGECSDDSPCPVHEVWKRLRGRIRNTLHERTLAQIAPPR